MTPDAPTARPPRRHARPATASSATGALVAALTALTLAGCTASVPADGGTPDALDAVTTSTGLLDPAAVHDVEIEVEDQALDDALATYLETGEKVWVTATVTLDGTRFDDVGLRLKGNSSLRTLSADSDPATLPWLVRLDKEVDGQSSGEVTSFVIRSSTTATALNEAVALDLLAAAGLAGQDAAPARVVVNDGAASLRLLVVNLDEAWRAQAFGGAGVLYKAEAGGDYSYRGDEPAAYDEVFDQETGEEDLAPLIELLAFLDGADDATFAAELPQRLDVEAFARYLALEDLIGNFDDIEGPGNNSYLHLDTATGLFTVVAWDHNLAFGVTPARGTAEGGAPGDGVLAGPGGMAGDNVLARRFRADEGFAALLEQATADLEAELVDSGLLADRLAARVAVLEEQAADLVDAQTLRVEAAQVAAFA